MQQPSREELEALLFRLLDEHDDTPNGNRLAVLDWYVIVNARDWPHPSGTVPLTSSQEWPSTGPEQP